MKKLSIFLVFLLSIACALSPKAAETDEPTLPPAPTETEIPAPTQTETPAPTPTPTLIPMTDADFTDLAETTCTTLESALQGIADANDPFFERYSLAAEAYQIAFDSLSDVKPDQSSAPDAVLFMDNLQALPSLYRDYGQALTDSLDASEFTYSDISFYAVMEEGNHFMVYANEEWQNLDVNEDLRMGFYETKSAFETVSNRLGLNACASVDPIFD